MGITEFSHTVLVHKSKHIQAEAWCRELWGVRWSITENRSGTWGCFWAGRDRHEYFRYYFADEQDAVLFSLRWL